MGNVVDLKINKKDNDVKCSKILKSYKGLCSDELKEYKKILKKNINKFKNIALANPDKTFTIKKTKVKSTNKDFFYEKIIEDAFFELKNLPNVKIAF